jgi:hypothetical protein
MTAREVIAWIVVGILIAFGGFMTYKTLSVGSDNKLLTAERDACWNAPVTIRDSIRDTIIYSDRWHTPKPVPYPVYIDTVKPKWCEQDYSDNYKFVKGILVGGIHYQAHVRDCQLQIQFDSVNLPIDYRIVTKTVLKDTCIKVKQPFFRWGPYAGMTLNSFSRFPGIEVGAQLIIKDQVTISGGGLVLNGVYGNIRIGVVFKK